MEILQLVVGNMRNPWHIHKFFQGLLETVALQVYFCSLNFSKCSLSFQGYSKNVVVVDITKWRGEENMETQRSNNDENCFLHYEHSVSHPLRIMTFFFSQQSNAQIRMQKIFQQVLVSHTTWLFCHFEEWEKSKEIFSAFFFF